MRKYIFSLVILIMVCCISLTGCNLFERDNAKYLAQVVATTKEDVPVKITMEDVVNGYNNWGYQYFQSGNVDKEQATKQIINDCIDRKYLIRYFEEHDFTLEDKELWLVKQNVYESINSKIEDLEDTIKIEWKWSSSSSDSSEKSEEDIDSSKIYTPYESNFKFDEKGNIVFSSEWKDETEYPEKDPGDFKYTSIGNLENADADNRKLFTEAKNRYFNNLSDEFEDRGITGKSNEQLLNLEIERLTKTALENAKIIKLQNYYNKNILKSDTALDATLDAIYEEFKNKYNEQKQRYSNSAYIESYRTTMLNSSRTEAVYYHPSETDGEFFTVTHLLLKFSDETQSKLDEAKKLAENGGGTYENYAELLNSSYSQIKLQAINPETGKPEGKYVYPADVISEVEASTSNGKIDLETFRKIQFKYQGDTAVYSSTYDYVIPTDPTKDTMVKSFADTSRELRKSGVVGKVSGLIKSEYGYHIIVYTGEVTNFLSDVTNKQVVLNTLLNTRLKADRNKTYLDLVYESINSNLDNFNTWTQNIVDTYRNGIKEVVWYPHRYKKFYEQ